MCDPPTASTPIEPTKGCRGTPGHLSDTLGAVQTPHVCLPGIIAVHDCVCQRINEKNLLVFCQSNKASQIWMVTKKSFTENALKLAGCAFEPVGYVADCGLYEWAAAKWGRPQLRLFFTGNNVILETLQHLLQEGCVCTGFWLNLPSKVLCSATLHGG